MLPQEPAAPVAPGLSQAPSPEGRRHTDARPPLPAALVRRRNVGMFHCAGPKRVGARVCAARLDLLLNANQ